MDSGTVGRAAFDSLFWWNPARHKKKRKRHGGETKTKRAHTGYTLFVHENYDAIKKRTGEDLSSKDVLAEVAQQWSDIGEQERLAWQFKAEQLKRAGSFPEEAIAEVGLPEPPSGESEDWGNRKRAARKSPPEKDLNSVSV